MIFYGDFTRRDWSFPGGRAIKIRGGALTHGRRLLGSKRVSDFHARHARRLAEPNLYSPVPNQRSGCLGSQSLLLQPTFSELPWITHVAAVTNFFGAQGIVLQISLQVMSSC